MANAHAPSRVVAGWISLKEAIDLVSDQTGVQPNDRRRAKNAVRQKILYAEEQGCLKRRYIAGRAYFPRQPLEFWAIRAWPKLKLRDVFRHPDYTLVNLTPELGLVELPPSVDHDVIVIPDSYDELREAYLCELEQRSRVNWLLAKCRAELAEHVEQKAAVSRKRSDAGKKGAGVSRR